MCAVFSTDSTCSLSSCSICTDNDESDSENENDNFSRSSADGIPPNHSLVDDYSVGDGHLMPMKKSLSADILNHPPLPKFPRYNVKRNAVIPPLPLVANDKHLEQRQLRSRSLEKLDVKSSESTSHDNSYFNNKYQPSSEIDQTLGIPLASERIDMMSGIPMAFYPSLGPYVPHSQESFQIPTTIHQYPLVSATIPSTSTAKTKEYMPYPTTPALKEPISSPASILLNSSNVSSTNPSNCGTKRDSGEKNKVKFSDVVNVAVVPEIPRKEKFYNMNDRVKRRPFDPRRELAESLPLFNPEDEYLKDFQRFERNFPPVVDMRRHHHPQPPPNRNGNEEHKKKSTIKVVHFGVV